MGPDGLHLAASLTDNGVTTPDIKEAGVPDELQSTETTGTSLPPPSPTTATPETAGVGQPPGEGVNYTDQQEASDADPRPKIVLPGKDRLLSDVAAELGHILARENIYRYAGQAAVYDEKSKTLGEAKAAPFRLWSERFIIPIKKEKKGESVHSMSSGDAGAILASRHFLDCLREVERINPVCLPITRADKSVALLPEGYDRESKILMTGQAAYAADMTATEAVELLSDLLEDFPFADEGRSRAVAIAAMLTLYGLNLLPARTLLPVIVFRANCPGVGKGLLAQLATLPVLGYTPTGVDPKSETEMRKSLLAVAMAGEPVLLLDNVTGKLASASLESFITAHTVTDRKLGTSEAVKAAKNTLVLVTGNNVVFNDDMTRRAVVAELTVEGNPAGRVIENRLDEHRILELRPQILAALYALVRAWEQAGKPEAMEINPNFETWSRVIGGIVEYAGLGSVTAAMEPAAPDADDTDMQALVEALYAERQQAAVTFTELTALAAAHGLFTRMKSSDQRQSRQANTALGRFLSSQNGRVFGGLRFVIIGSGHARRFAVQRLTLSGDA